MRQGSSASAEGGRSSLLPRSFSASEHIPLGDRLTAHGETFSLSTKGELQILNITETVADVVSRSKIREGIVCVFTPASTAAITTLEYEPGLVQDLPNALQRLFPKELQYKHEETWADGNGHSHVRASFLGQSVTIPIQDGRLVLGTWQQLVFVELDIRGRQRKVIVQAVGT